MSRFSFRKTLSILALLIIAIMSRGEIVDARDGFSIQLDKSRKTAALDSIVSGYNDWGRVSISGKLSSPMLPVTATVKVFMEKDKLTLLSVAAPLVGEVMRLEIDNDYVICINKMGRTYVKIPMKQVESLYPGGQNDLQNMLLGRVCLMGCGALRKLNFDDVEIYDDDPAKWIIVPDNNFQPDNMKYLYTVNRVDAKINEFIIVGDTGDTEVLCNYSGNYDGSYAMEFEAAQGKMKFSGLLSFNTPMWGAEPMTRFQISSKYREITLEQMLRSM